MLSPEILSEIARLLARNERFALGTLIEVRGSTPQKAGARILVRADGTTVGTLGGGCIEAEAVESARAALREGGSRVLEFELTEDIAVDYGLACGGNERILVASVDAQMLAPDLVQALTSVGPRRTGGAIVTVVSGEAPAGSTLALLDGGAVHGNLGALHEDALAVATRASAASAPAIEHSNGATYFVEPIAPPTEVIVVGAGHVGRAVAEAASLLGHRIAVIDDRPEFANRERFPGADAIVVDDIERGLAAYPATESSAIVIVTRGHKWDYQALSIGARSPASYVGLMGSRRKVALIYRQLLADGISADRLRAVHAPIGLDIGAVTPEEIAISILAEITMCRLGGDGGPKSAPHLVERAARRVGA